MARKVIILGFVFPTLLLLGVLALDTRYFDPEILSPVEAFSREMLYLGIFLLLIWGTNRFSEFEKRSIPVRLWLVTLIAWLTLTGFRWIVPPLNPLEVLLIWVSIVVAAFLFAILRTLIFVQQGKGTNRNFVMLVALMVMYGLYTGTTVLFQGVEAEGWVAVDKVIQSRIPDQVLFSLVLFWAAVNGFRCKWIHYLNKRRKIAVFFFGSLFYSGFLTISILFMNNDITSNLQEISLSLVAEIKCLYFFILIYFGMSLLAVLFHLPSAGLMDRRIREIKSLQTLSTTIGRVFDMNDLVTRAVEIARKVVGGDYVWLELKNERGYSIAGVSGIRKKELEWMGDSTRNMIREAVRTTEGPLLLNDISKDSRFRNLKKWKIKAGSLLAAVLRFQNEELGFIYTAKTQRFGFVEDHRGLYQALADQIAVALQNAHLIQVTIDQQVYREELRVAHDAQMRLLPREMPRIPGIDLDAFCWTANEIGGDFYDVIQVGEERLDLAIGDVSGKGASAAFYMAELKGVIQALAPHFSSPKKILQEMNTFLRSQFERNTFATMVYGSLDLKTNRFVIARAGHNPVYHIREKQVTRLEIEGIGLGLTSKEEFYPLLKEKTVRLKKGDTLFFYTDGLVEARNRDEEEYGEEVLAQTLGEIRGASAAETMHIIQRHLEEFTRGVARHDDITVMILRLIR
jgi:serine phosphatase RsbU (regulator of sigma subunit)